MSLLAFLRKVAVRCGCALALTLSLLPARAADSATGSAPDPRPMRVILVGDSTLAPRTGYGDALCRRFQPDVTCINLARGGRSSGSYRAEGLWDRVTALLRTREAFRATYVLIQFGHNDQPGKPGRSTDLATEFPANMARYVEDVKAERAIPVLLTPLTRRSFKAGVLQNDLKPWADATRRVAQKQDVALLELNADSAAAVAAMGSAEADTFAMAPPPAISDAAQAKPGDGAKAEPNGAPKTLFDHTHLGEKGADYFSAMVAREIAAGVPALAAQLKRDASARTVLRPQLTPAQAAGYSLAEVLKYVGKAGKETVDPWDPLADPLAATGKAGTLQADYIVDAAATADGKSVFNTVQSAVDRAVADSSRGGKARLYILVQPGVYRELVYVPASAVPITLYGQGKDATQTRIGTNLNATMTGARYAASFGAQFAKSDPAIAAMYASLKDRPTIGTAGSAVAWIRNRGFQARNLTFENLHNKDTGDADPESGRPPVLQTQAVALMVDGADRVQFENVRFLGFQDTLFLKAPEPGTTVRAFVHKSYVEGDMDFIFGDATAYFLDTEIKSLGDRRISYLIAPSTHYLTRFGFVFQDCRFTHDGTRNALAGTFHLARQWFRGQRCTPYGTLSVPAGYRCTFGTVDAYEEPAGTISTGPLEAVGKVVILESRIGAHIDAAQPWSEWNALGTQKHRPVQFDSSQYWTHLVVAGIDPVKQMGYAAMKQPPEPFLAEYRNVTEPR